jgi:hypothetical protein
LSFCIQSGRTTDVSAQTTIQPKTSPESSFDFKKLENGVASQAFEQNVGSNYITELNRLRAENERLRAAIQISNNNAGELEAQNRSDLLKYEALFSAKEQELEDHRTKASADMTGRDTRIRELERLNSSFQARDADQNRVIAQLKHQNRSLDDNLRTQRGTVDDLMKEREQAMANRLKIDTFDSSIDRVSEAQLISHIEDVNSLVDDLVASVLEDVTSFVVTHPSDPSSDATMMDPQSSHLLKHALEVDPGSDNWGLLVDCLLHQKIVEYLHTAVFSSSFGVPVPDGSDGENLEVLHKRITGQGAMSQILLPFYVLNSGVENWRATQRWRSVTAKGLDGITSESTWRSMITTLAHDIQNTLAAATHQSYAALDPFHDSIDRGLQKAFEQARKASLMISTDMVSVRVRVVLGTMQPECKEILWPEMGGKPDDADVGDYTLGLLKVDEYDKATALLPSKVATNAVIRYVHTNVA